MMARFVGFLPILALQLWPALAAAQEQQASAGHERALVYSAEFFEPFAPRTALDMAERVPGFVIEDADEEQRGLGGAVGNVLIDGAEPTAKSQSIDDILARIPASDVVRIELLRGGSGNAATDRAVRINVVRAASGGDGVWSAELERADDGRVSPVAEVAWTGRAGAGDYNLSFALDHDREPVRGLRRDFDAAGALDEWRTEHLPGDEREYTLAGGWNTPLAGGELALTGQARRSDARERESAVIINAMNQVEGSERADAREREGVFEFGASYDREWAGWTVDAAALVTRRRFEGQEANEEREADGALDEVERQTQDLDTGETIFRVTGERALPNAFSLELGGEAAVNTLEQRLALTENGAPVDLPSANVRVEEERAEAFATLGGSLPAGWHFEASIAVEASTLSQSGDADRTTDLTYWKPSLQLTRAFGGDSQLRLRAYRDVGQLDFEDFVSVSDLRDSQVDAGNPDLRPDNSWRFEAATDWRFGDDGALSVTLYHWLIEDALDIVPVGPPDDLLSAPGNIGDARAFGARTSLTLPLPAGFEFRLDGFAQDSRVTDPLTGEERALSGFQESAVTISLRQDLLARNLAWGVAYERETYAPDFRLEQIEHEQEAGDLQLWVETTAFAGVKVRVWGSYLGDESEARDRLFFDPDRSGAFDGSDARSREEGRYFGVELSGAF